MITNPSQKLKTLISTCILSFALPSQSWANQGFYREFLDSSGIVTVSGEQADEHHARINSIQIAHDQYREIRTLNPDTGATDILEFSDPTLKVTYSLPYHGHFLKLKIRQRERGGLRTADFALASDDSHYILVRNRFRPYQTFHQSMDFSSVPACRMPDSAIFNKPAVDPALAPYLDTPENIATRCLDSSCQRAPFSSELDHLTAGITEVVSSRSSGSSNSGRFLSCLNQHHLQHTAAEMQQDFSESLKVPNVTAVVCENRQNGDRGEFSEKTNLIYFRSPWAYGHSAEPESDAASYYADTFFHESLHKAGIEDEDVVHNAVSCCGLEKAVDGTASCNNLDKQITATNQRNSQIIASMDTLKGFREFWLKVEKESDDHRINTIYDDFFEMLKTGGNGGGNKLAACIPLKGKSQDDCFQNSIQKTDESITQYFDTNCPNRFADKSREDSVSFCQDLKKDALNVVNTNASSVCDSTKESTLERSCLFAVGKKKGEVLAKAQKAGDLLDAPDLLANDQSQIDKMKLRDAFLTSYAKEIPALETAYNQIKEKYKDETAISLFSSMLNFLNPTITNIQKDYAKCVADGSSKSDCADTAREAFLYDKRGVVHFFRQVCKSAFTSEQAAAKPCKDIGKMVVSAFKDSFSGGCKTSDPAKQIGVPGNDLTCLFSASQEGMYNYQHYDQLVKENKLLDADGRPMTNAAVQQAKDTAASASKSGVQVKSVHIGDQANKKLAQDSSSSRESQGRGHSGANRAPASEASPAYAFDPSRGFESQLTDELRHQPTPARKVLQDAGRVISDLAVPSAEAHTNDTSSLALKAPESIIPGGSAIGGDLESTRAINIGIVDPLSVIGQNSRSARAKEESASKAQGQSAADKSVAASDAASGRSPASASGTPKGSTASTQTKKSSHGHDAKTSAQSQDSKGHIPGAHDGTHLTQKQLLEFFKDHPREALDKLKSGALSSDLMADHVQAIDDLGHEHGSKDPQIKIWYNSKQGIFMGLPDL